MMNIGLCVAIFAESGLLFWLEKKFWKSLYTPLNFLMLPYVLSLSITLLVEGRFGVVGFYYPSILPWLAALPLFALPGWIFWLLRNRLPKVAFGMKTSARPEDPARPLRWKIILSWLLFLFMAARVICLVCDPQNPPFGSEKFGDLYAARGLFGHLLVICMSLFFCLLSLPKEERKRSVFPFDAKNRSLLVSLVLLLFFIFVYLVKSWILLPILAAFFSHCMSGQSKIKWSSVLGIGAIGVGVFFLCYLFIYFSDNALFPQATTMGAQLKSIAGLMVHYLTSGTFGLSMDMQQGILEPADWRYLFPPLFGLAPDGDIPAWFHTGINYTNVRSLIGSLYIFLNPTAFVFFVIGLGAISYLVFFIHRNSNDFYVRLLYSWLCAVLVMGWFVSYLQLTNIYEIPFWIIVFGLLDNGFSPVRNKTTPQKTSGK